MNILGSTPKYKRSKPSEIHVLETTASACCWRSGTDGCGRSTVTAIAPTGAGIWLTKSRGRYKFTFFTLTSVTGFQTFKSIQSPLSTSGSKTKIFCCINHVRLHKTGGKWYIYIYIYIYHRGQLPLPVIYVFRIVMVCACVQSYNSYTLILLGQLYFIFAFLENKYVREY